MMPPALQALQRMAECSEERDTMTGLVCLAAQMAFEVRLISLNFQSFISCLFLLHSTLFIVVVVVVVRGVIECWPQQLWNKLFFSPQIPDKSSLLSGILLS